MRFFSKAEYGCRCARPACDAPDALAPVMAERLDMLRESIGRPLVLTSGLRCAFWNEIKRGAPNSRHKTGQAVDIACASDAERYELLEHILIRPRRLFPFIDLGPRHVHVDVDLIGRATPMLMLAGG